MIRWAITLMLALGSVTPALARPYLGLSAGPFATDPFNGASVEKRFRQSVEAGANFVYLSPKWNELEQTPGQYRFRDLDSDFSRAARYHLMVALNLRILDTNQRSVPADLATVPWDSDTMRQRLFALIDHLGDRLNRVSYLVIGNEVDPYFRAHSEDIAPYAALFVATRAHVRKRLPHLPVSVTVTLDGLPQLPGSLHPIDARTDFLSVTCYPLQPDFTVRSPSTITAYVEAMIKAAGARSIFIQEAGCPSGAPNGSSPGIQAAFFQGLFAAIKRHGDRFIAINIFLMADWPESLVAELSSYYRLPGVERFRSFLGTLGLFDIHGLPKPAWTVFRSNAPWFRRSSR